MEKTRKSPAAAAKMKKKMTREQMQLAIIKKKECDAKALKIVEQLIEPNVDPTWLVENLKHINRCHMEDVIEERAITKLCGYVLCQKPLTVVIKQQYHISLKDKKVYDVTKKKNFCSSSCYGASNYLLEQMLSSPLWMRDKEEIPNFRIFSKDVLISNNCHGTEVDINIIEHCKKEEDKEINETENSCKKDFSSTESKNQIDERKESERNEISGDSKDFVLETFENIHTDDLKNNIESTTIEGLENETCKISQSEDQKCSDKNKISFQKAENINNEINIADTNLCSVQENENDIIKQCVYPIKQSENNENSEKLVETDIIEQVVHVVKNNNDDISIDKNEKLTNVEKQVKKQSCDKTFSDDIKLKNDSLVNNENQISSREKIHTVNTKLNKNEKLEKSKHIKKKKQVEPKIDINLAARVEKSFQEWVTDDTVNFLFGNDSVKQKAIGKIELQDKYSLLCEKLNRLQFQEEQEDAALLEKPALKPAPHFEILKEEGKKLDIKVRAFYQGKTTFEEHQSSVTEEENTDSDTFLPLTDVHSPHILRRKVVLEKLDQVLPDLLRTLAGNNEVYARASCNYTSVRCTAVKALVHTFSLTATNIIFKTAEWTLVGLIIIKMLSLLDPWLANLLLTKQANMYISMILTSYKLDAHYLNLFVASFNPNMSLK